MGISIALGSISVLVSEGVWAVSLGEMTSKLKLAEDKRKGFFHEIAIFKQFPDTHFFDEFSVWGAMVGNGQSHSR